MYRYIIKDWNHYRTNYFLWGKERGEENNVRKDKKRKEKFYLTHYLLRAKVTNLSSADMGKRPSICLRRLGCTERWLRDPLVCCNADCVNALDTKRHLSPSIF